MERRKVLFTDGMSDDFLLIITDAPKADIEKYCRWHVEQIENGWKDCETFQPLKAMYYIKELLDPPAATIPMTDSAPSSTTRCSKKRVRNMITISSFTVSVKF